MTSIMRLNNYIEAAHPRSHNTNYKRYCNRNFLYSLLLEAQNNIQTRNTINRNTDYNDKIRINQ